MSKETDEMVRRVATLIPIMLGIFMLIFTVWTVVLIATSTWHRDELRTLEKHMKLLEDKCKVTP